MAKKKHDNWQSYLEDYYNRRRESVGMTENDYAGYRQYVVDNTDASKLKQDVETARSNYINSPSKVTARNKSFIDYASAVKRLNNFIGIGGTVDGVDDAYMKELEANYTKSYEDMQRLAQTNRMGFGGIGMQTTAGILPNGSEITGHDAMGQRLMPGRGLIDPKTGMPTESNQRAAQKNYTKSYFQQEQANAGEKAARWGQQAESAQSDKELADKWLDAIANLPVTNDARVSASNDAWMRQAAQELGIESYIDRDDLLRKIRVKSQTAGASGKAATTQFNDYMGQYRGYVGAEYQLDNPNESIQANYYKAMRDAAARDAGNWDNALEWMTDRQALGDWFRYNSAYGDQVYADRKNEEILALRSDPQLGQVYQGALESTRIANRAQTLATTIDEEISNYGGISETTAKDLRELAAELGITVGAGDANLQNVAEQILSQYTHEANTNLGRLQAQGYDPERLSQYIDQALNEETMDAYTAEARAYAAEKPVAATIGSSVTNLLSGAGYIASAPRAISNAYAGYTGNFDNYVPIDTNTFTFMPAQYVMAVRDEVAKNIQANGGDDFLYGVGTSILDNMAQMAVAAMTFGGSAAASAAGSGARTALRKGIEAGAGASLATMGLSVAGQELVTMTEAGVSSDQAYALATVKGATEIITEKIGIDSLLDNLGRQYAGNFVREMATMIGKQMGAEGMEEVIAEVAGTYADWIVLQEESDIAKMFDMAQRNGMTKNEALWETFKTTGMQVLEAGAAGALSGGLFGAASTAGVVADALDPATTGARIRAEGTEEALGAAAQAFGLDYNEGMSDREIGKLYRSTKKAGAQMTRELTQGISMESYAKEKGYDTKTTRALKRSWDAYRSGYGNDMSSRAFAATWNAAKAAGQTGMSFEQTVSEIGTTELTQTTLESAWKAGQRLRVARLKQQKATATEQASAQQETIETETIDAPVVESAPAATELVHRESESASRFAAQMMRDGINVNALSDEAVESFFDVDGGDISTERRGAMATAKMVMSMSKNISQVIFVDNSRVTAEGGLQRLSNGMWDPTNRTLTIDINAGRGNIEQQMTFMTRTMSHELTHSIKTASPEQYGELERFVLREMDKQGNIDQRIAEKIELYAQYGIELDEQGAKDELVAEACEQMLERTDILEKLAQENKTLWEKIRDFIKNAIAKLKKLYNGLDAQSEEARMMASVIDELQAKWDAAFAASLTAEATKTTGAAQQMVAGRNAANADLNMLALAEQMEAEGATAEAIYKDTGWWRGADEQWRFEIDDSTMRYTPDRLEQKLERGAAYLEDIIDHPVLFEAYPKLRDVAVAFAPMKPGAQGVFRRAENKIYIADSLQNAPEDTLVHEVQHVIQTLEGFAYGASSTYWQRLIARGEQVDSKRFRDATKAVNKFEADPGNREVIDAADRLEMSWMGDAETETALRSELKTTGIMAKVEEYEQLRWEMYNAADAFQNESAYNLYRNTAGEQEAEDVTSRRTMTAEERKQTMPQRGTKDTVFANVPTRAMSENLKKADVKFDRKTMSVAPVQYSVNTLNKSDYVTDVDKAARDLAKALNMSSEQTKAYLEAIHSIAAKISANHHLDYESSPGRSSFVGNVEYGGSFDFSTLCAKRRLMTGTFTAIQEALPNTVLTAADVLEIRNRMKDAGYEVSCGLCYVEGSRANMGVFTKKFLELYEKYNPGARVPTMAEMNTPDGIERIRVNADGLFADDLYEQYEYFWNHYGTLKPSDPKLFASQQKPKLYQMRTEYKGEILKNFTDPDVIDEKNRNGGIRLQSFSDFEIVHLLDCMQIITDMARVKLAGQAYTKVPEFAWALGNTGLKINLSLIAKEVDADGNLIFDDVEGMDIDTAMEIRNAYSKNVGTIVVIFNDEQLKAAMNDDRVDYIIPFHRSQWKKSQYGAMGLHAKTKDYTYMQNEKFIKPQYHEYRGRLVKDKAKNYMPNEYWREDLSGKENAEEYLKMCARENKRPKFYKLLDNNGDGSYSLKKDGSTDGYWKLLIDFKMYDNEGNYSPQLPVRPEFNMEKSHEMLENYKGGHRKFPVAQKIVDEFVADYKKAHPKAQYQVNAHTEMDRAYAEALNAGNMDAAQRLVEQAAATAGYWRTRWHETKPESDFHVFNINRADNASADNQTPYGIFTKAHDRTVGLGGKQMRLFVRADRILRFRDRDTMKQQMPEEYKALLRRLEEVDAKYGAEAEEMEDQFFWDIEEWLEAQPNEDELRERIDPAKPFYESIGDAMPQELIDLETRMTLHSEEWHEAENVEILAAKEWLTKWLPANGYDAMELEYDNGAGARVTDALIVLSEDQVKLADVITRDDDGNIIPLSERFKAGNKDIRYQISRDTASTMDLLMGASMDGLSKAEADHLLRYRDRVQQIRDNQRKIDELKAGEQTAETKAEITKLQNRNSIIYRQVSASEKTDLLKKIADRERAAGDIELERMDNKIADLEDEIDELERKVRDANLAGRMGQGRADAAALRKTTDRSEAKLEKQKAKAAEKADKLKQKYGERAEAQKQKYEGKLKEQRTQAKQDVADARLAGQMGQGRRDAATLRKTEERLTKRNEKQKQAATDKAAKQKQQAAERLDAQKQKYSDKLKEQRTQAKQAAADARLAGQMGQGRRDAVALQRTVEEYEARLESKRRELRIARESRDKRIAQMQESRIKSMDSRHRTQMRHKIRKVVKELDSLLLRGTKDRNIRDDMKAAVASALEAIDMTSADYEGRIARLQQELEKETDPKKKAQVSKSLYRLLDQQTSMKATLSEMSEAYRKYSEDNSGAYRSAYDAVVQGYIDDVFLKVADTPLWDMTQEQLEAVYKMYRMILEDIQSGNKLVRGEKKRTIQSLGRRVINGYEGKKRKQYTMPIFDLPKKYGWSLLKPEVVFDILDSDVLSELYWEIQNGEAVFARDAADAQKFFNTQYEKFEVKKWDTKKTYDFYSAAGNRFSLNLEQMMSLYAYKKRKDADKHLENGGFVYGDDVKVKRKVGGKGGERGIPVEVILNTDSALRLSRETYDEIIKTMDEVEPNARGYADAMQAYLSDTMGEKGNEVTLDLYGVRLFGEENYFPIKTANQFRYEEMEVAGDAKIVNSSFSKHRNPEAKNPIILSNFTTVWEQHVVGMSMYHALTIPLENFNRVYNYQEYETDTNDRTGVRQTIKGIFGREANDYIHGLLVDINGGIKNDPNESMFTAGLSKFKLAKTGLSLSVIAQQPTSIFRAAAYIDLRYLLTGDPLHKATEKGTNHKKLWEEMNRYASVSVIKDMGGFDTGGGRSAGDWITKTKTTASDVVGYAPAKADELTWTRIWSAVKLETAKKTSLKPGTEEFLQYCGRRCDEILVRTQVYDSTLTKPAIMRSKGGLTKMVTAFMAEPLTQANMLIHARVMAKRGYKKMAARERASVVTSLLVNSALVSLVYAMRDDDDDENFLEKYAQALGGRLRDDLASLLFINSVPIFRDIYSKILGYDIARTDMSIVSDLIDSVTDCFKEDKTVVEKVIGVASELSNMFGFPLKNIIREVKAVINTVNTVVNGQEASKYDFTEGFVEGILDKNFNTGRTLYNAYVSGDEEKIRRAEAGYREEHGDEWFSKAQSDLRAYIKKRYLNGGMTYEEATDALITYGITLSKTVESQHDKGTMSDAEYMQMLENEAYWTIKAWETNAEDPDASTARYADLYAAISSGGDATAAMEELMAHGYTEKEISSEAASYIKTLYKDEVIDRETAEDYLAQYAGRTDSKDLYEFFNEADHYIETGETGYGVYQPVYDAIINGGDVDSAVDAMVEAGWTEKEVQGEIRKKAKEWLLGTSSDGVTITVDEALDYVSTYGGVDDDEWYAEYGRVLEFWAEDPSRAEQYDYDKAAAYTEYGEGIDIDLFFDVRDYYADAGVDDGEGGIVKGTKKSETLNYINSLPLTNEQKDQLYLMYWKESRIYEAPWR